MKGIHGMNTYIATKKQNFRGAKTIFQAQTQKSHSLLLRVPNKMCPYVLH